MPSDFLNENLFPPSVGLGQRVRGTFALPFHQAALESHHARDELLRGRYNKAVPELIETRRLCRESEDRLRQEEKNFQQLRQEVQAWIEKAFSLYADQQRATGNPQKLEDANRQIEALWRDARAVSVVVEGTRALPLRCVTSFQLALCKHEQAERMQLQSELNSDDEALARRTVEAWNEAVNLWQQYVEAFAKYPFSGNAPGAAARLLGRAQLLSGDRTGAVRTWRLDVPTAELEKVGNLYLAKQNEK